MKIKTSELKGTALDWAVAMCEYPKLIWGETIGLHWVSCQIVIPEFDEPSCYWNPCNDWAQGGPIIEAIPGFEIKSWLESSLSHRFECHIHNYEGDWICFGGTLLEAAMRCYVASKLGDTVDVPDALGIQP